MPLPDVGPSPEDLARWLALEPSGLLRQCVQSPFQGPGPGGQKRNRVYSGVRISHPPSGLSAEASERREARRNLEDALHRLRLALALACPPVSTPDGSPDSLPATPPSGAVPPTPPSGEQALGLAAAGFRAGCNPSHPDYPRFAFAALLALDLRSGRLSEAAAGLGCTASALTRLLLGEKRVWARTQAIRQRHGLHPLKSG